eukprot:TRINITY_DN3900_c8_g1_i1.p1 TRINITY_DN3900_c8_g1~~TRINITY_DN3900_c8_g1_i1.p1  ORF type:complete len:421 (+),score=132.37 TRINITY_DN3900_c8_g1_i1:91-1353(+)
MTLTVCPRTGLPFVPAPRDVPAAFRSRVRYLFVAAVQRHTHKGGTRDRVVMITSTHLIVADRQGTVRRFLNPRLCKAVILQLDAGLVGVRVPTEFDIRFRLRTGGEVFATTLCRVAECLGGPVPAVQHGDVVREVPDRMIAKTAAVRSGWLTPQQLLRRRKRGGGHAAAAPLPPPPAPADPRPPPQPETMRVTAALELREECDAESAIVCVLRGGDVVRVTDRVGGRARAEVVSGPKVGLAGWVTAAPASLVAAGGAATPVAATPLSAAASSGSGAAADPPTPLADGDADPPPSSPGSPTELPGRLTVAEVARADEWVDEAACGDGWMERRCAEVEAEAERRCAEAEAEAAREKAVRHRNELMLQRLVSKLYARVDEQRRMLSARGVSPSPPPLHQTPSPPTRMPPRLPHEPVFANRRAP